MKMLRKNIEFEPKSELTLKVEVNLHVFCSDSTCTTLWTTIKLIQSHALVKIEME